jgi:hypothetical protein
MQAKSEGDSTIGQRCLDVGTGGKNAAARKGMVDFEETLISVWRQAFVDQAKTVTLGDKRYPVKRTSKSRLRQVDFEFRVERLRGLEQNPNTNSRWAQLAREGRKVMQFLNAGQYIANVANGKLQFYK